MAAHLLAGSALGGISPDHTPALVLALLAPLSLLALHRLVDRLEARRHDTQTELPADVRLAALLLVSTGAAHLALLQHHATEQRGIALAVLLDALLLLAVAYVAWTGRSWRRAAVLVLTGSLLAYPLVAASQHEAPDQAALAIKLVELTALGLALRPGSLAGRLRRPRAVALGGGLVTLGAVTGAALWGISFNAHEHAALNAAGGHHHHDTPVGMILPHRHEGEPTAAQRAATDELLNDTRAGIARFADPSVAIAEGYRRSLEDADGIAHWEHKRRMKDGTVLDPNQPEQLVYADGPDGLVLLGAVYVMPRPDQPGPAVGGASTRWHAHSICVALTPPSLAALVSPFGGCPAGTLNVITPEMLHVWLVEHPGGPFAEGAPKEYVQRIREHSAR